MVRPGFASAEYSSKSGKQQMHMDHGHDWLMFADSDVIVATIEHAMPNDLPGPRELGCAYFDATACQFTGHAWSFEACFGPDVESSLVQDYVWTVG